MFEMTDEVGNVLFNVQIADDVCRTRSMTVTTKAVTDPLLTNCVLLKGSLAMSSVV